MELLACILGNRFRAAAVAQQEDPIDPKNLTGGAAAPVKQAQPNNIIGLLLRGAKHSREGRPLPWWQLQQVGHAAPGKIDLVDPGYRLQRQKRPPSQGRSSAAGWDHEGSDEDDDDWRPGTRRRGCTGVGRKPVGLVRQCREQQHTGVRRSTGRQRAPTLSSKYAGSVDSGDSEEETLPERMEQPQPANAGVDECIGFVPTPPLSPFYLLLCTETSSPLPTAGGPHLEPLKHPTHNLVHTHLSHNVLQFLWPLPPWYCNCRAH